MLKLQCYFEFEVLRWVMHCVSINLRPFPQTSNQFHELSLLTIYRYLLFACLALLLLFTVYLTRTSNGGMRASPFPRNTPASHYLLDGSGCRIPRIDPLHERFSTVLILHGMYGRRADDTRGVNILSSTKIT